MKSSRVVTLSLGLLAALLFTGALTLTPTDAAAGTVCSCPSSYIWQTAHGSASGPSACPTAACRANAEANAAAACGFSGVCSYGSIIYGCYLAGGQYQAVCDLQYVCNVCIDEPD